MAKKPSVKAIRESLLEQLEAKGGASPTFVALVEDYCNWEEVERKLWAALKKIDMCAPEWEKINKQCLNASNRKMQILKQLEMKTTNVVGGDDEEL